MRTRITLVVLLLVIPCAFGCGGDGDSSTPTSPSTPAATYSQTDVRVGTGAEAVNGRRLTVNYTLWLYDAARPEGKGQQLQTSVGAAPFAFTLGNREVIAGWDQGVPGMRVGGLRRLVLPPNLAYGSSGSGPIPPNASLVFDIELLAVQ